MVYDKYLLSLFPTPLLTMKYDCGDNIRTSLLSEEMVSENTENGFFSKNTYVLNNPTYEALAREICINSMEMMTDILGYDVDDLKITQSWISHKDPKQIHKSHFHSNSILSGVYYFDEQTEIEPIIFEKDASSTHAGCMHIAAKHQDLDNKPFAWDFYSFNATANTLIIFPSWLKHRVDANKFNQRRKSLAFNIVPRVLGHSSTLNELSLW